MIDLPKNLAPKKPFGWTDFFVEAIKDIDGKWRSNTNIPGLYIVAEDKKEFKEIVLANSYYCILQNYGFRYCKEIPITYFEIKGDWIKQSQERR